MKKSKILAPALAVLCLSVAASVTGTVAWFAANNVVTADGMTVKSTLPSSLAINSTYNPVGQETSVTLSSAGGQDLNAVSHYHGSEDTTGGLWSVTNGQEVNPATGLAYVVGDMRNGQALTAEDTILPLTFAEASGAQYFRDFTVYIGSVGADLTLGASGKLTATITFTGDDMSATNLATTVDFYSSLGAVTESLGSYVGCVNAAGVKAADNHGTYVEGAPVTTIDVISGAVTIPVATSTTDALKVTMRVYYDGALQNSLTTTYVATNTVVSEDVNIEVAFSLTRGN